MTPRMQDRDDYQRPTRKQHVELKESFISRSREGYLDKHGYEMTIRELQTIMKYNEIDDTRHQFRRDHVINEKVAKVTKEPMVIVEAINLVELIVT